MVASVGALRIDLPGRTVSVDGRHVHLTPLEFELLRALAARPTAIVTTAELLRDVWRWGAVGETRVVSTTAHRLRRKLGPGSVESVRGHGLRLVAPDAAPGARRRPSIPPGGGAPPPHASPPRTPLYPPPPRLPRPARDPPSGPR